MSQDVATPAFFSKQDLRRRWSVSLRTVERLMAEGALAGSCACAHLKWDSPSRPSHSRCVRCCPGATPCLGEPVMIRQSPRYPLNAVEKYERGQSVTAIRPLPTPAPLSVLPGLRGS